VSFRHFRISVIGGSRRQRLSTAGLAESKNPKFFFQEKVTVVLEVVRR
jgi:hypothetical protein